MDISHSPDVFPNLGPMPTESQGCEAAKHVSKRVAYYNVDNCPYLVYAVDPEKRCSLVPEKFINELRQQSEPWVVCQLELSDQSIDSREVSACMATASRAPCIQRSSDDEISKVIQLNPPPKISEQRDGKDQEPLKYWGYNWQSSPNTGSVCRLPATSEMPSSGLVAIYNNDPDASLQVMLNSSSKTTIPAQFGMVFQRSSDGQWKKVATHFTEEIQNYHTNPLMHDVGPTLKGDDKTTLYEGEYFLTPEMVQDLVEHNTANQTRPPLCKTEKDVREVFEQLSPGESCGILLQHDDSPHTAAAFLLKTDNGLDA